MDYTTEIWGKERQDEDAGVKDWLKSFYSGKQDVEDIKITPELRERYNRFVEETAKQYTPEAAPNAANAGTLGQSVLQNVTKSGLGLMDLLQRSGRVLNPYLMNPAQESLRQQRSQELGYGIAGTEELEKEKGLPPGLAQKIVAAASQMAVDIPAKYANPAWAGVMIGEGILGGLDKGGTAEDIARQIEAGGGGTVPQDTRTLGETALDVAEGGVGGAINAATLKGLGAVGKLAPGYARPLIEGGGFAGMAAAPSVVSGEPVDVNDIISNALIGGFFGFKKRNEPRKTLGDFKNYVTEKLGRKLTLDENIEVSRAGLDAIDAMRPAKDKAAELAELQKQAEIEFGERKPTNLEQPTPPRVIGQGGGDISRKPTLDTSISSKTGVPGEVSGKPEGPNMGGEKPKAVESDFDRMVRESKMSQFGGEKPKEKKIVETEPFVDPHGDVSLEELWRQKRFGKAAYNSSDFTEQASKIDRSFNKNEFGWQAEIGPDNKYHVTVDIPNGVSSIHYDKRVVEIEGVLNEKRDAALAKIAAAKPADSTRNEFNNLANKLGITVKYGDVAYGKATPELNVINLPSGKFDPRTARHELLHTAFVNDISRVGFINEGFTQELLNNPEFKKQADAASRKLYGGFGLDEILKSNPADEIITELLATKTYAEYPELKRFISDAVNVGKPIHPELLKDYPDLVKPEPPTPPTMNKRPAPEAPPPGKPPAPGGMKPYEPVMKESGPAKDVWKKAVEDGLADPENPWAVTKYESANRKEFAERTIDYIGNDINRGWDVIEGKTQPPPGTSNSSFFLAMRDYVNKSGDGATLNRFAKASGLAKISEAGSALGQLSGYKTEETAADAVIEIERSRKKHNEEIKENPYLKNVLENRLMKAQDQLAESMARHEKDIERLKAVWHRKRLDQYKKRLGKRELTLTEKIKMGDFTKDPQYKIWLDQQTRSAKRNVDQLQKTFNRLKDIADRRETGMSDGEAQELANRYEDMRQKKLDMESGRDRMAYGRSYVDFHEYKSELMFRATKMTFSEALRMPGKTASKIAGISKAIKAAFDNSYIFRQGFKTLVTHPKIWLDNSTKSFKWAVQQYGGKHVMRELMADIVSRPNFINGKMERAKLSFGNPEEPFPTSIPEKIWFFGKIYKASETAFAGQAYKTRADLFDKFMDVPVGNKKMVDIADKKKLESIGKLVNSLTGRGYIGKVTKEQGEFINNVFFSLRFLKSNFDFLTAHQFQKGVDPFVRKEAAKNLLSATISTAAVLAVANALKPGSVEWDSRSADFGKIRIGNTRFDVTGGMGSLIILASRMIQGSTKSSVSGKISKGTGIFGDPMDYVYNFFEGKLSPVASTAVALIKRKDYRTRKPPTISDVLRRTVAPLPVENAEELLRDPKSADFLLSLILDGLGIGTNTYGAPNKKGNPSRPVGGFDYTI